MNKKQNGKPLILVVDDDRAVCSAMMLLLKRAKFDCQCLNRFQEIEPYLESHTPDLIILDMNFTIDTSGKQGMKALALIKELKPLIPVILITGWATIDLAVRGMKAGASDFIAKPWENKALLDSIKTILTIHQNDFSLGSEPWNSFEQIIGQSPSLKKVLEQAKRISKTDASVLIEGESGTGKELIAEAIHYESLRENGPFVKVNLGGISASLFESEMFGHKKGAFTDAVTDRVGRFEKADGGTIFLDELGELDLSSQVKLLRVLQEKSFEILGSSKTIKTDFRIISATNKSIPQLVEQGQFREDLFYRINLIHLKVPPLRQRKSDIPLLVDFFLDNLRQLYNRTTLTITDDAISWLTNQDFPGNIRQLKNIVERTVLLSTENTLTADHFQPHYQPSRDAGFWPAVGELSLEEMEIEMIRQAMSHHRNQISAAAKALGITRHSLYRRLQKYQIDDEA